MKATTFMFAVFAVVVAHKKKVDWTNYPVEVSIEAMEGSVVKVKIENLGPHQVNMFSRASLLDPNPVRKLNVTLPNGMFFYIASLIVLS
jgi:hypothetical protein